jgi:hypothetical protein
LYQLEMSSTGSKGAFGRASACKKIQAVDAQAARGFSRGLRKIRSKVANSWWGAVLPARSLFRSSKRQS